MKNCNIVQDLLPLYEEGLLSEESVAFVNDHLETCESCKKKWERTHALTVEKGTSPSNAQTAEVRSLKKLQDKLINGRVRLISLLIMMGSIVLGLSLTNGMEYFFNALIMPFIGVLGYVVFRWKAIYMTPLILTFVHVLMNTIPMGLQREYLDFQVLVALTFIYCIFMLAGVLIAGLLHFAFKKEKEKNE